MAGIYVHIPFCKSRCIYCGFFSTTTLQKRGQYVDALCDELQRRKSFLHGEPIETIYFGGGTPSLLAVAYVEKVLRHIYNIYNVHENAEITLEGNPDDLSPNHLKALYSIGINRLSIGVQTFSDARLKLLNRRHTAIQAIQAIENAQQAGFSNISIDLMFGFPTQTLPEWEQDVQQALSLGVQHLSAYSLMYEEGTRLEQMLDTGEIEEIDEEASLRMYEHLIDATTQAGFKHYEISNFALPRMQSRHNSNYWHSVPYLGVGAGAHSYDGHDRCFNLDSLDDYFAGSTPVFEHLTEAERYDEFVFTGLRTSSGINLSELEKRFGSTYKDYCLANASKHISTGCLIHADGIIKLSRKGLFISNDVMSDLMWA